MTITLTFNMRQAKILKDLIQSAQGKESYEVYEFRKLLEREITNATASNYLQKQIRPAKQDSREGRSQHLYL